MDTQDNQAFSTFIGLTKREYIATQILVGIIANNPLLISKDKHYVKGAIDLTDELLKQLKQ